MSEQRWRPPNWAEICERIQQEMLGEAWDAEADELIETVVDAMLEALKARGKHLREDEFFNSNTWLISYSTHAIPVVGSTHDVLAVSDGEPLRGTIVFIPETPATQTTPQEEGKQSV